MFGVGLTEIVVIVVVAMIVLGPDRLPELARQAARFLHQARKMARSARDELRTELGPDYADLELRDLDPRVIVRKHLSEALADVEEAERTTSSTLAAGAVPPYDVEAT